MCYGCWQEFGEPMIDTPAVRAAAQAIGVVYSHDCVGGNLHNLIEDWNLEDGNLDFCAGSIAENFFEAPPGAARRRASLPRPAPGIDRGRVGVGAGDA